MADSPRLRRIVIAYTVNQVGTWFGVVALSLGVFDHTHSDLAVAAVLATPFLPALLAPAVVARVEASPRRGMLSLLYVIEAASLTGMAILVWRFWLPGILLLVAIDGGVAYPARALLRSEAARSGSRPGEEGWAGVVSVDQRTGHRANAALNISLALSGVVGPALAGAAVAGWGSPVSLLIDAGCFVIAAALVIDLRPYISEAGQSVRARLGEARAYLGSAPGLRAILATEAFALVFFTLAFPVEVQYAKVTLGAGAGGYGALLAIWGVGMVVGSLLFARIQGQLLAMLIGGTAAVGGAYVLFGVAPNFAVASVGALLGGLGNGTQWASLIGLVQTLTPERLLGRMMGVVEAINSAAPVLGFFLGGAVAALTSPRAAMIVAGVGALIAVAAFVRIRLSATSGADEGRVELVGVGKPAKSD
jgi:MFS family permease